MHDEVMAQLSRLIPRGGARIAAAIPHGFGKTTMASIALPLWALAFGHTKHCVLMSDTRARAGEALVAINRELSRNWRLAQDYPHLRGRASVSLTARELIVGEARVSAVSRTTGLAARRFGPSRPDLIVVDDAEGAWGRFKPVSLEWLRDSVVSPASASANIVVAGTIWNSQSLLNQLLSPSVVGGDWWARRYKAIIAYPARVDLWIMWELVYHEIADYLGRTGPTAAAHMLIDHRARMTEGGKLLWPERDDLAELLQRKVSDGWWRFESAMLNCTPKSTAFINIYDLPNTPPPNRWTDDAGMVRDSYQDDPATARVLLPESSVDPSDRFGAIWIWRDQPVRPRKDLEGVARLQVETRIHPVPRSAEGQSTA